MHNAHRRKAALRLVTLAAAAVVWAGASHARSLQDIRQSNELRVCIAPIHPTVGVATPEGCRRDCTFSGPAYEETRAFVASLGGSIQPTYLKVGWDEQFHNEEGKTDREGAYTPQLLASGTCDLYPSKLTKNIWRLKKLDFVTLFVSRMMVIVNKAERSEFKTTADLAGKVAAVEADTSFHTWLQEQNATQYANNPVKIELMAMSDGLKAVDAGEVGFSLMDSDAAIWATRFQFKQATVAFPVGPTDEIGWAFRKADSDLQDAVRAFFSEQKSVATSRLNQIWEESIGLTLTRFEALVRATQ